MKPPKKETVKKLRKLQKYILEEPRRLNMSWWGYSAKNIKEVCKIAKNGEGIADQVGGVLYEVAEALAKQKPPCGTIACLAGNAAIMAGLVKPKFESIYEDGERVDVYEFGNNTPLLAAEWLGLSNDEAAPLFYLADWGFDYSWPDSFTNEYYAAKTLAQKAKVACARIDYYIETGE